jgi:uncharacterized protein DUF6221
VNDLIAFWSARLAEEEAVANAATPGAWMVATGNSGDVIVEQSGGGHLVADFPRCISDHGDWRRVDAAHVACHDPASALRDVEADRGLIAAHENVPEFSDPWIGLDLAVRIRAKRFSSHPDYRPEWAP